MSDSRVPTKESIPSVQSSNGGINPSAPTTAAAHTHGDRSFRCSDAVRNDCDWTVTGNNEDEILGYMRSHAREVHGKNEFTPTELSEVRRAIHKRAA